MPDWRDHEIEHNIRDGFAQSCNLDLDYFNKKLRPELDTNPTKDPIGTHKTANNNAFGVIINKPFENWSALMASGPVENGINGVSYGESDLAYYDWPAIDNFEDVDRLFRNSDLTFGQRQTMEDEGEELSWFPPSSDAIYTSEMEVLNELSAYSSPKPGPHESALPEIEDALACNQMECEGGDGAESAVNQTHNGSSLHGLETVDMIRNPHLSVESITQELVDQNCSLVSPSNPSNSPFVPNQRHQLNSGSSSYLTFDSYPGMESTPSQVEPTAQKASLVGKKAEKLKNGQMMNSIQQPLAEKPSFRGQNCKNQFERGTSKTKGVINSSMVIDGSSNNNNSSFSSDDPSVEQTSFSQLQDVMNQLDVKTKLCIRDSLYRLARSVQQRNDFSDTSSSHGNGDVQYSTINNRFVEPINPETGTNPIDRSVAELLFHQPPGPASSPGPTIGNIEEATFPKSCVSASYFVNI